MDREKPRVIVTTDINNGPGDPDDRQSLCHLLFYADLLDIEGIVPDRFSESGKEGCDLAFDAYEKDYNSPDTKYKVCGFPTPDYFRNTALKAEKSEARDHIIAMAHKDDLRPLNLPMWGNMEILRSVLAKDPSVADTIRVFTIATNVKAVWDSAPISGPASTAVSSGIS